MRTTHLLVWRAIALLIALAVFTAEADSQHAISAKPTPPSQAMVGPVSEASGNGFKATAYGESAAGYWIIEPTQRIEQARPVVLFVHGLSLTNYTAYASWITHLVQRGNVVIYPRYQTGGVVDPRTFTPNTAAAAQEALARCDGVTHQRVDTHHLTMIGHSLGGTIVANLAARPEHFNLPKPKAIMLLQPGDSKADQGLGAFFASITEDHRTINAGTLMLIVDVANDYFVSPKAGQRIYDNTLKINASDKRRLLLHTDDHGEPAIIADHMLPMGWTDRQASSGRVNAYDFALWRWFDALQATAQGDDQKRAFVFGDQAMQMGQWSDGVPVRRPLDVSCDRLK